MGSYQLRLVDRLERPTDVVDVEAPTDLIATELAAEHSGQSDSVVEVWSGDNFVIRVTPMTAQLLKIERDLKS